MAEISWLREIICIQIVLQIYSQLVWYTAFSLFFGSFSKCLTNLEGTNTTTQPTILPIDAHAGRGS